MKLNFNLKDFTSDNEPLYSAFSKKPKMPYLHIALILVIGILTVMTDSFIVGASIISGLINKTPLISTLAVISAMAMHFIPLGMWAYIIIKKSVCEKNLYYILTDDKIVVIFNTEYPECKIYYLKKLKNIIVKPGKLILILEDGRAILSGIEIDDSVLSKLKDEMGGGE